MESASTLTWSTRRAPLLLALACLLAMGVVIGNQLAQDDIALVLKNPAALRPGLQVFVEPYWPPGFSRDLYRPLTTLALALQWRLSAEHPWVIHAVSLGLYIALTLSVWGLARRLMAPVPALLAALVFAVHPVHVEAVALGVNQSELMVGVILGMLTSSYIDARKTGKLSARLLVGMLVAFVIACLFKEHAIVFPVVLVAVEATVLRGVRFTPGVRRQVIRLGTWLVLLAVSFLLLRTLVLRSFAGTFPAEALVGAGLKERLLTVLGIVPVWARLFAWPAHLQADYSPGEIVTATGMGQAQWIGLALLVGWGMLLVSSWRRAPAVSFGLLWMAIALAPVSNLLLVIGIVVAERTLLLPSIGFVISLGAGIAIAAQHWDTVRRPVQRLALAAVILVLFLGMARSLARVRVWNTQVYLGKRTLEDAPKSYRAHYYAAQYAREHGDNAGAEQEYLEAIALWPRGFGLASELGDLYRTSGMCEPAIRRYRQALEIVPEYSNARLSLVACLLWIGSHQEAWKQARLGRAWGHFADQFVNAMRVADSALVVAAPPGTVRLPEPSGQKLTTIGPTAQ